VQCYDALSMNLPVVPDSTEDGNSDKDEGYSRGFVLTVFLSTLFVSLFVSAALSFVGYRYINNQSLSPLMNTSPLPHRLQPYSHKGS
jgi:hypothetical protein